MYMYARVCVCLTWRSKSATVCFSNSHPLPISYHTDELDELQSHRHHNRFAEVVYGTNHLVVTVKQGFHQLGLVFWAEYWSCWAEKGHERNAQWGQRSSEWVTFAGVRFETLSAAARVARFGVWLMLYTNCGSYDNKCIFVSRLAETHMRVCCQTQLTPMFPQISQHRNWNHRDATVVHVPNITPVYTGATRNPLEVQRVCEKCYQKKGG